MAERKAVNKYYPSDFDPRKHGSINKYRGTHPLRERARKLHEGILIIRFEMPYNIWCDGCNNHIGMGVRYNAQKSKTGMYYSTPIYKFRMKCHLCDNHIEMQTDPKNLDYMILSGARRQERRWNPSENEQIVPEDKDTSKKLSSDAMFRLEHNVEHENKANTIAPVLEQLEQFQQRWKDDYAANQLLRNKFRTKKKETLEMENKNNAFLRKKNLLDSGIKLIAESEEDAKLASLMKLESIESFEEKAASSRMKLCTQSIFERPHRSSSSSSSSSKNDGNNNQLQKIANSIAMKKMESLEDCKLSTQRLGVTIKTHESKSDRSSNIIVKSQSHRGSLVAYSSEDSD